MERLSKIVVALWGTVVKRLSKKRAFGDNLFYLTEKRKMELERQKGKVLQFEFVGPSPKGNFFSKVLSSSSSHNTTYFILQKFFFGVEVTTFSRVRQHVFYQTCRIFVKSYFSECHFWSNLEKDMTFAFVLKSQTYHFTFQITEFWRQNFSSIDL